MSTNRISFEALSGPLNLLPSIASRDYQKGHGVRSWSGLQIGERGASLPRSVDALAGSPPGARYNNNEQWGGDELFGARRNSGGGGAASKINAEFRPPGTTAREIHDWRGGRRGPLRYMAAESKHGCIPANGTGMSGRPELVRALRD